MSFLNITSIISCPTCNVGRTNFGERVFNSAQSVSLPTLRQRFDEFSDAESSQTLIYKSFAISGLHVNKIHHQKNSTNSVAMNTKVKLAAVVGWDWSNTHHHVVYSRKDSVHTKSMVVENVPAKIHSFIQELQKEFNHAPVGVAIENCKGGILNAFSDYESLKVYLINPKCAKNYRMAFKASGIKTDKLDASKLHEMLDKHQDQLKEKHKNDPVLLQLEYLVRARRNEVNERTRRIEQLHAVLSRYYPLVERLFKDFDGAVVADFICRWQTLKDLQKESDEELIKFFIEHNCKRWSVIFERLKTIRSEVPLSQNEAINRVCAMEAVAIANNIKVIEKNIESYDKKIKELYDQHPDSFIFKSLKGSGSALGPRLLVAFGGDRKAYKDARAFAAYCGVAPVEKSSGKMCVYGQRKCCDRFLLQTFHEFANVARRYHSWANKYYQAQRDKGKTHHTAVRALAYKFARVLYRCWLDKVPYDERRHIDNLKRYGSPYVPDEPKEHKMKLNKKTLKIKNFLTEELR